MDRDKQPQTTSEEQGGLAYKWKVLISVVFGVFMIILDTTVVNVAFQTLRREFGATLNDSQWIISVYVLALGISTPMSGFLADRFGVKRMYIGGLTFFVLGSLLCGIAPNLWWLVGARALQGAGGGVAQPLASALLYSAFPVEEQGLALGFFGIALVVAPALGPILGGWLVDQNLWRAIFFINLPVGAVGLTLASRFLRPHKSERKPRLDPLGLFTSVVGFGSVLYAASIAADRGWGSTSVVTSFGVGAAALLAFVVVELFVAKEPMLDLRLFKRSTFLTASLIGYVTVLALFGAEFLLPVYLQALRGRTALETGFILLPMALTSGVVTPVAGRLYDKIGPRPLVVAGFSILLINTWQLAKLDATTPISWILFLLALRGAALGMTVQTTFATALSAVPRNALPRGSSLVNSTRFVVQSIGVAILSTILVSTLSPTVQAQQQQLQDATPTAVTQHFGICETPGLKPGAPNLPPTVPKNLPPPATKQIVQGIQQACTENLAGFDRAYTWTFYVAILAIFIGMFLPGWPLKWAGRTAAAPTPAH
jgi:DHA2 family multidrug resistance protein